MASHWGPTMTVKCLSQLILLLSLVGFSIVQGAFPTITDVSAINNQYLREDLPIGYPLGSIKATGNGIMYYIRDAGGEFFQANEYFGNLTLKKLLDFETEIEIKSIVFVTDADGQSASRDCKVFVIDVNDNPPAFTDTAIFRTISEAEKPGYIVSLINVTDRDTVNLQIQVTCGGNTTLFQDACDMFTLVVDVRTNKYWNGMLVLNKTLDFETRNAYNIRLIAFDGVFNVYIEVHIEVQDVNDTPPKWAYVGPKNIDEEQPIGSSVQQVMAYDGDSTNPREIRYEMCPNTSPDFNVNSTTGVIFNTKRLDYDGTEHEKGVPYDICIKAREVINYTTGQLGNDPTNTAAISFRITIEDINDNGPVFSQKQYVAYVDENIARGSNIPGLQMTVTDIDSGTYNSFDLRILNNNTVFGIIPSSDAASSSATIFVIDGIDYEEGPKQYILEVRAIQNFNSSTNPAERTGSATVTVIVKDVNDETPVYDQNMYNATIYETATPGTVIATIRATDREAGDYGTAGIRYRLYGDNAPPHFQIDELTGVVSVAPCNSPNQPGTAPCIDYERKKDYTLTVSATDNRGLSPSRTRSVQLFINVLDVNDNEPRIDSNYIRYINEDQRVTINPLLIEPIDPDTVGGPLTFTIRGDQSQLWQVTPMTDSTGRQYGNITATRPIKYRDAQYPSGEFNFAVVVQDQQFSTTAYVRIIVIDTNDNSPRFIPYSYEVTISETTKGGVFVTKVSAMDADAPTTGNGIVDVSIQSGAQGKFTVTNVTPNGNEFVADIITTQDAVFNYEIQKIYNMLLIARDRGSPLSLYGTANLTVYILDANDRSPQITPSYQSVTVYENEPPGRNVYQVKAFDPDVNNKLEYFMTAKEATTPSGDSVNAAVYDFTKLFRLEKDTGNVIVNAPLDRDKTNRIQYNLTVVDINANPQQSGYGSFLINIREYNDQAPYFDSFPAYELTIVEELNINSYVQNLNCRDVDDTIAGYLITQDSPRRPIFFALIPGSGNMIVSDRIDYDIDRIEQIELTAQCTDQGDPPLSNTTRVIVHILNINDNSPIFQPSMYRTSVRENTIGGTLNVTVTATDIDRGDFGVVRYKLNDPHGFFSINEITGVITIFPNATFDRETTELLTFTVIAYDSPLNETVRRNNTAQVYVYIDDINDNCPVFRLPFFIGRVPESADIDTNILDIDATDADAGLNGQLVFSVKLGSGIPPSAEDYFAINPSTGRVFVRTNIKDKIGFYNLTIIATDMLGTSPFEQCSRETTIQIEIQQSSNHAPIWIRPPNRDYVIYVLESQYYGMVVYSAKAIDNDVGPNGVVDYFFVIANDQQVNKTAEFQINRVTGIIRAEIVYDRETRDTYVLNLLAKDRGDPSSSTETTLIVAVLDVNDNTPVFPLKNGVVEPLKLTIPEDTKNLPYVLGRCNATDADSNVENNRIYYDLLAARNEIKEYITVDNTTCTISLIKPLDYESMPSLKFDILAYNQKNDDSVKRYKREVNPSIQPVIVEVENSNDNPPVFTKTSYKECVSVDAPLQQKILQVSATDVDGSSNITYSISGSSAFQIDQNGYISNIISFRASSSSQRPYSFNAYTSDGSNTGTAMVTIFVTSSDNTAVLTVNQPLTDVLTFKQQISKVLVDSSNGAVTYACIVDVKKHINEDGQPSTVSSDVYVTTFRSVNGQYVPQSASETAEYVNTLKQSGKASALDSVYVTGVQDSSKSDKFILEEDAVLAVLIICILLLFLAILLLCIACICIRNSDKKKKKNIKAASHTIVHVSEPLETSVNPVYNVGHPAEFVSEPVEYSTVKKVRPVASETSPVVLPSFVPVHETSYIEPEEPPRIYSQDPDLEPVIMTEVEDDPIFETEVESESVIETEVGPSTTNDTDLEPEPVFETLIEREPSPELFEYRPTHLSEFEERLDRVADDGYERPVTPRVVSFPERIVEDEEPITAYLPPPSPIPSHSSFPHLQPDYDSE